VDFVREGPDKFWSIVKTNHRMNGTQLNAWKQAPDTYRGSNGVVPAPLETQFEEIENALGW